MNAATIFRTAAAVAAAAAATLMAPTAAQAAGNTADVYLSTTIFTADTAEAAAAVGERGIEAGYWSSYEVTTGFVGHLLDVSYTPTRTHHRGWTKLATVARPNTCADAGRSGMNGDIWRAFSCVKNDKTTILYVR